MIVGGTSTTTVSVTISLVPVAEDLLMVELWNVEKLLADVEVKAGTVMLGVLLPVPSLLDVDEVFATEAELILVLSLSLLLLLPPGPSAFHRAANDCTEHNEDDNDGDNNSVACLVPGPRSLWRERVW